MNKSYLAAAIAVSTGLGGCATLTEGLNQSVFVTTPGAEAAACILRNDAGDTLGMVTTPGTIEIGKSRKDLVISCSKVGFEPAQKRVSSSWADRAKLQGPQGYVIDYVSGAMWNYPSRIEIVLTSTAPPQVPRARRGGAQPRL
jgi:hypothetical protein